MNHDVMTALVLIGSLTLASQWLAWRSGLPAILFLLISGVALGPTTGMVDPDAVFGDLLFPFVSLGVAAILFEGSLTLKRSQIAGHGSVVRNLVTVGPFITWAIVSLITYWVIGVSWQLALLFGSLMTVTGPTVITPMLRAVRPNRDVANILRWEGILIDPVGAILAVLTFNVIVAQQLGGVAEDILVLMLRLVAAGVVIGAAAGHLWGIVLRRYWVPHYLQSVATLLIVFIVFWAADSIEHESGLLAVTVMGVWLANMRDVHVDEILDFKERLSVLLISALFIILAARLEFAQLVAVGWPALIVLVGLQLVARPAKVFACAVGSTLSWQERTLISWIGPRGIIAAAISALFALRLEDRDFANADLLVPLTFIVIAGTVVLQSLTARPLAKLLGLANPSPEGILLVGANVFSRALAEVLQKNNFSVLIAGSSWHNLKEARMAGIKTFYGSPLSSHAEEDMDLTGIGKVIGTSTNAAFNDLVCSHFSNTMGRENVFWLPVSIPDTKTEEFRHGVAEEIRGRRIFSQEIALENLISRVNAGATIRTTQLTADYDYEEFRENFDDGDVPLLAWSKSGKLHVFAVDSEIPLSDGWTIATLVAPEEKSA